VLALLDAARETPEDDTPRMILADWLDRHGDAHEVARAEFIRLQCRVENMADDDSAAEELWCRTAQLAADHEAFWLGSIPRCVRSWQFRRGLLDLTVTSRQLLGRRSCWPPEESVLAWVDGLRVEGLTAPGAVRLAQLPLLERLLALRVVRNPMAGGRGIGSQGASVLAASLHLLRLRSLDLNGQPIGAEGTAALAASTQLPRLTALKLDFNDIGDIGAVALARSRWWPRLTRLHISGNGIGSWGMHALVASSLLTRLTALLLAGNNLDSRDVALLAQSPGVQQLRALDLSGNAVGNAGAVALACSLHLTQLTSLDLADAGIGVKGKASLRRRFGSHVRF
jgi:uncharacterized protein (TIGR02996 family)